MNLETPDAIEEWRPVVGYEGLYSVSSTGRVRADSLKHFSACRVMKTCLSRGYPALELWVGGSSKNMKVHRLVACAFLPNPGSLPQVNHKNGIKTDNRVENLEWCTAIENSLHARNVLGRVGSPKTLTTDQVVDIRSVYSFGESTASIAARYGISDRNVRYVVSRKTWSHVP